MDARLNHTLRIRCGDNDNVTLDCYRAIVEAALFTQGQLWVQYKKENKTGADLYTIVILGLFASVIVLLLCRSVKQTENVDDQVAILLSSMQIHVDYEERQRQRKKMKEDKGRAQAWLMEMRLRSLKRLTSNRGRSSSCGQSFKEKERNSVCSVPTPLAPFIRAPCRARSYQGYLPEIVVTDHQYQQEQVTSSTSSRPTSQMSRQTSASSCLSPQSLSLDRERFYFQFPESDIHNIP